MESKLSGGCTCTELLSPVKNVRLFWTSWMMQSWFRVDNALWLPFEAQIWLTQIDVHLKFMSDIKCYHSCRVIWVLEQQVKLEHAYSESSSSLIIKMPITGRWSRGRVRLEASARWRLPCAAHAPPLRLPHRVRLPRLRRHHHHYRTRDRWRVLHRVSFYRELIFLLKKITDRIIESACASELLG